MTEQAKPSLQLLIVPVQGRRSVNDYIWCVHNGQQVLDISHGQFWTQEHARSEGLRFARNMQAAAGAVAYLQQQASKDAPEATEDAPVDAEADKPAKKGKRVKVELRREG